jgi:hypothetical protein
VEAHGEDLSTETPTQRVTAIHLEDKYGTLVVVIEGFPYPHDHRYLRGQIQVNTRHFAGNFQADFEWPEIYEFAQNCHVIAGKKDTAAGSSVLYDPKAEKYLRLQGDVQKSGSVKWTLQCRPFIPAAEVLHLQISTELATLSAIATGVRKVNDHWPLPR